ncbi:glycosyltransferase [Spirosoma sp.]|uniref:glycosyltransferase n=1 Tax=Spirosoma sp. TaxID=1899569 RepID=UPI003B3A4C6A
MKIALSVDCFYPAQMGGPSNAIYWQAKALTQAGHDVVVVAISDFLPPTVLLDQWLKLDCGQVIYTRNPHFYFPIKHIWYGWQIIRKADVVHVNSLFYPASFVWVVMSRLVKKPVVWAPHGELSPAALRFRTRLKQLRLKLFRRVSASISFHATCAAEAADIRTHFGQQARVTEIRNMMELPQKVESTPARSYLLFIGRLHPIKAVDRLIDAVSKSPLFRESEYSLLIVGPDDDKVYSLQLKSLIKRLNLTEKIVFQEPVYGKDKERLYADALVTILPSHAENFGNVVIESMAQGTPVIASTGTPWQQLEIEQAGHWVHNDSDSLRRAIETYMTLSANDYESYRKRAFELAHRDFDMMRNVALWENFYRNLLKDQKNEPS